MTPQEVPKKLREDEVLLSFLAYLRTAAVAAALVEQPDRLAEAVRTFSQVTSDGLLTVDQKARRLGFFSRTIRLHWAVDIMAMAAPHSHAQIPNTLQDDLNSIAQQSNTYILLEGGFEDIAAANVAIAEVKRAVASGTTGTINISGATVTITPTQPGAGTAEMVHLQPSPSADLSVQMAATMQAPLQAKVSGQAARARAAGCRTAVLLDWVGHEGIQQGTHWLARSPHSVQAAVASILAEQPNNLDAVFLLDRDDNWHLIYGRFPGLTAI